MFMEKSAVPPPLPQVLLQLESLKVPEASSLMHEFPLHIYFAVGGNEQALSQLEFVYVPLTLSCTQKPSLAHLYLFEDALFIVQKSSQKPVLVKPCKYSVKHDKVSPSLSVQTNTLEVLQYGGVWLQTPPLPHTCV